MTTGSYIAPLVNTGMTNYNDTQMSSVDLQDSLDDIIARYRPVITFKVKKSIGSQTPDWEDVVNEIMINIIDKLKKGEFRGDSSIGTYIYTITSRRIIDYIRRKSRVLHSAPQPEPYPDPQESVELRERADMMTEALDKLKPKYKEVLYLYYYKDLNRDEVARKLGLSPRRVSERVHYAQKLLRKIVEK